MVKWFHLMPEIQTQEHMRVGCGLILMQTQAHKCVVVLVLPKMRVSTGAAEKEGLKDPWNW